MIKKRTIFILIFLAGLFAGTIVFAQGYQFEVQLPELPGAPSPGSSIANYINYLFVFALALSGFLALGMMTLGGLQYVLAAGNVSKVEEAKNKITQALIGLGVILVSFLLLRTINPDLVKLKNPDLSPPSIRTAQFNAPSGGVPSQNRQQIPGIGPANIPTINTGESCKSGETMPGGYFCIDGKWNLIISGT